MTAIEFRGALIRLGWTQVELAKRIDAHVNTVSRWAKGHGAIPGSVSAYLQMAEDVRKLNIKTQQIIATVYQP